MSFAYRATTTHTGLSNIMVNCVEDKLVITNNVINHSLAVLPGEPVQQPFAINWSNVSKFTVDRVIRGAIYLAGAPTTRIYHFEFVNLAVLPVQLQELLRQDKKFSFSITDNGPSLLYDIIQLGSLNQLYQNGDYIWEVLDNPTEANNGGPRAIGWGRDTGRLQVTIEENYECSILIWRGSIPFTETIIDELIELEFELRSSDDSFDYLNAELRIKIHDLEITRRMIRYFRERFSAHHAPEDQLVNGVLESTCNRVKEELLQNPVIPFSFTWYTNDREVGTPRYGETNTVMDPQPQPALQ